jgi:tetratricopeptide (TPR) repeat protein
MAVEEFTNAIQAKPNYSNTYWYRGNSYEKLGQDQNAINDYTKAIQLDPDDAMAYRNRGVSYYYLENTNNPMPTKP